MLTPGAATVTKAPRLEKEARVSDEVVAATEMNEGLAGVESSQLQLPAAATTSAPWLRA